MTFLDLFRPRRPEAPARTSCPFCPGTVALSGPLCSVCRAEALRLGRGRA